MTKYPMFNNAKVLFADTVHLGEAAASALELDPKEWAVLPLRCALLGWKIKRAVILWPSREMSPMEERLRTTWIAEHLILKIPHGEKPHVIYS